MSGVIARFAFGREVTTARAPRPTTVLIGRVLLSLIFLFSGFQKLVMWDATATMMEAEGMAAVPLFLALAIVFEIMGGLSVLTGTFTRIGALALLVFLIPATLVFHDYWQYQGDAQTNQMLHFMKNVTIAGGLVLLMGHGPGRYSVDALIERRMGRP